MSYIAEAHIEILTNHQYGARPGKLKMFERTFIFTPSLRDWIVWIDKGLIPITESDGKVLTIKPYRVKEKDSKTFVFYGTLILSSSEDSIEYYKKLMEKGWVPNTSDAKAIRSFGYQNFDPTKFM